MTKGKSPKTVQERFDARVVPGAGCWTWNGSRNNQGYGVLAMKCADGKWRPRLAHRVSYELHIGPIPSALVLDHLCRNPGCVNPAHLEPVTQSTNMLRGVHRSAIGARRHASLGGMCSVAGCEEPIKCTDLCVRHHLRLRRTGSPTGTTRKTLAQRLEESTAPPMSNGCQQWTGALVNGYAAIRIGKATKLAHRVAYEQYTGQPIRPGVRVRRRCSNRACVNPEHLYIT